jgi:hypothetical protein
MALKESLMDFIAGFLVAGSGLTKTYNDDPPVGQSQSIVFAIDSGWVQPGPGAGA